MQNFLTCFKVIFSIKNQWNKFECDFIILITISFQNIFFSKLLTILLKTKKRNIGPNIVGTPTIRENDHQNNKVTSKHEIKSWIIKSVIILYWLNSQDIYNTCVQTEVPALVYARLLLC